MFKWNWILWAQPFINIFGKQKHLDLFNGHVTRLRINIVYLIRWIRRFVLPTKSTTGWLELRYRSGSTLEKVMILYAKKNSIHEDYFITNQVLGEGASGTVGLCINKRTSLKYALKVKIFYLSTWVNELKENILFWLNYFWKKLDIFAFSPSFIIHSMTFLTALVFEDGFIVHVVIN